MFSLAATSRRSVMGGVRALSTSAVRNDVARMTVLGRVANDPEIRESAKGQVYGRYQVVTNSYSNSLMTEDGTAARQASFHRFYAFGEANVNRVKQLQKGYTVLVDADFRLEAPAERGAEPRLFAFHRK